jgi:hypothetical protein
MTATAIHAFYAALGIDLPAWAQHEAPVKCFAQPEAHSRGDRAPSCSINLGSGAWNCHGCGAHGGAYDAALALGHTPRSAMNLLIVHGLAKPRTSGKDRASRAPRVQRPCPAPPSHTGRKLAWSDADIQGCAETLDADGRLIRQLMLERAWSPGTIKALDIGWDGTRITIPVRNQRGALRGVLRYDPFGPRHPKMRAAPGTQLGLIPHPSHEHSDRIILVEGPPDMIAARSCGLPAIAIPGTHAWQPTWAHLLAGKRITIVMDCDPPGRHAADHIAASLRPAARTVDVIDLWPTRDDGYDLTDRILERRRSRPHSRAVRSLTSLLCPAPDRRRTSARETQEAQR